MSGPDRLLGMELAAFAADAVGRSKVEIVGTSMTPLLRAGMIAEITPIGSRARVGDILVFRSARGLIAHRVIRAIGSSAVITCGDACPEIPEWVDVSDVIGRVSAVWAGGEADALRADGACFRIAGHVFARTRALRASAVLAKRFLRLVTRTPASVPAFRSMLSAAIAFERGDPHAGVGHVNAVPVAEFISCVTRHGMGGVIYRWLDSASKAGATVPPETFARVRELRWYAALSTSQVATRARTVIALFNAMGVDAVLLKGAARLCSGEADANINPSNDVDVLVREDQAEKAVSLLREAGFRERADARKIRFYKKHVHHRAPLWPEDGRAPVEIHVRLCLPGSVSAALDYASLEEEVQTLEYEGVPIALLSNVGAALHLAYHARDFHVFRDIVLLGRLLRRLSADERERFDRLVARETRDSLRLLTAVAIAEALSAPKRLEEPIGSYLSWVIVREDLPNALRKRASIVEAIRSRSFFYFRGIGHSVRQLHRWTYNVLATPIVLRWEHWNVRAFGPGSATISNGIDDEFQHIEYG